MRPSGRTANELRTVTLEPDFAKHAEGSCLAAFGDTRVFITATVEQRVPGWLRDSGHGWVTAEYGMLPRSTNTRTNREASSGKQSGRTQEIQRLIGRSLRAVTDLEAMGEMSVKLDCDVVQADGGTRTASITGAYVALHRAFQRCVDLGVLKSIPLKDHAAAVSCGIYNGVPVLDLDYAEDSNAEADANFVFNGAGEIIEIQGTAEADPFSRAAFGELMDLADKGIGELVQAQKKALGIE
ncbi:MAG: ribonuclease PH [Alphaproteobacteria bacterium]|jgi:ribonuclease PH|nr:ribonuclease PH [Alphaproteobacteria bacterium]